MHALSWTSTVLNAPPERERALLLAHAASHIAWRWHVVDRACTVLRRLAFGIGAIAGVGLLMSAWKFLPDSVLDASGIVILQGAVAGAIAAAGVSFCVRVCRPRLEAIQQVHIVVTTMPFGAGSWALSGPESCGNTFLAIAPRATPAMDRLGALQPKADAASQEVAFFTQLAGVADHLEQQRLEDIRLPLLSAESPYSKELVAVLAQCAPTAGAISGHVCRPHAVDADSLASAVVTVDAIAREASGYLGEFAALRQRCSGIVDAMRIALDELRTPEVTAVDGTAGEVVREAETALSTLNQRERVRETASAVITEVKAALEGPVRIQSARLIRKRDDDLAEAAKQRDERLESARQRCQVKQRTLERDRVVLMRDVERAEDAAASASRMHSVAEAGVRRLRSEHDALAGQTGELISTSAAALLEVEETEMQELRSRLKALSKRLVTAELELERAVQRLAHADAGVKEAQQRMVDLDGEIAAAQKALTQAEATVASEHRATVDSIQTRADEAVSAARAHIEEFERDSAMFLTGLECDASVARASGSAAEPVIVGPHLDQAKSAREPEHTAAEGKTKARRRSQSNAAHDPVPEAQRASVGRQSELGDRLRVVFEETDRAPTCDPLVLREVALTRTLERIEAAITAAEQKLLATVATVEKCLHRQLPVPVTGVSQLYVPVWRVSYRCGAFARKRRELVYGPAVVRGMGNRRVMGVNYALDATASTWSAWLSRQGAEANSGGKSNVLDDADVVGALLSRDLIDLEREGWLSPRWRMSLSELFVEAAPRSARRALRQRLCERHEAPDVRTVVLGKADDHTGVERPSATR